MQGRLGLRSSEFWWCRVVLLTLVLGNCSVLHAENFTPRNSSAAAPAQLSVDDRKAIGQKIQDYIQAFVQGDEALLRKTCTENYIDALGGIVHFRTLLAEFHKNERWRNAHADEIQVRPAANGAAFAHYVVRGRQRIVLSSLESSMVLLKKETGDWKLDQLVPDVYEQ